MATIDLDYCFVNPNLYDFKADTLRKAIVKLHRLNAACHSSPDDWHLNMIEATKDLQDPAAQGEFYKYLSNPSGFTENKELWDALEKFDELHADPKVREQRRADPFDESNFTQQTLTRGNTQYIFVKNETWVPPPEEEPQALLGPVEEEDEKAEEPDEEPEEKVEEEIPGTC